MFDAFQDLSDPPVDSNVINTIKVQKRNKEIVKIMWHQWFNRNFTKLREYFVHKENKNNDFIQQFVSSAALWSHVTFRSKHKRRKQHIRVQCCRHRKAYVVYVCDTLRNGATGLREGDELLNKVVIFVVFAHKKYFRSSVKLQLNHWCHMDYFTDLLAKFLSLDCVNSIAVNGRVRELSECIKNILICAPKILQVWNDMRVSS